MTAFNLTITGDADADDVRSAFEDAVRALRSETSEPQGELKIDGVPYDAADVPDAADVEGDEDADEPASDATTDTQEG